MRDKKIDLLRFIALSSLIMAHIDAPGWLIQLQNFNVPLIVMASAMALAHTRMEENYASYVFKRVKRLVLPVWLFLTFYFIFLKVTGLAPDYLTAEHIWYNYTFANAGGFMWIIRVFLLVALVAPFIYHLDGRIRSNGAYLGLLLLICVLYEGSLYILDAASNDIVRYIGESYISYAVGYGLIFALGLRLNKLTSGELWTVAAFAFVVFAVLCDVHYAQEGHFVPTQRYKYPPSAYYLSYATAASVLTWRIAGHICAFLSRFRRLEAAVMFIAQNSLWVYFWHTIFLFVAYRMHAQGFLAKYSEVYFLSVMAVVVQFGFVTKWVLPRIPTENVRKEIKGLLTG